MGKLLPFKSNRKGILLVLSSFVCLISTKSIGFLLLVQLPEVEFLLKNPIILCFRCAENAKNDEKIPKLKLQEFRNFFIAKIAFFSFFFEKGKLHVNQKTFQAKVVRDIGARRLRPVLNPR